MDVLVGKSLAAAEWARVSARWMDRSLIAAEMFERYGASEITDIGCGAQFLKSALPPHIAYQPVDVVARAQNVRVVDLNVEEMPIFRTRQAAMLGVFEYLDDVPAAVTGLRQFDWAIISYCHHAWFRSKAKRARYWRNHYTKRQFRDVIAAAGLKIIEINQFRPGEAVYLVSNREKR